MKRKSAGAFRTISEVADELGVPKHVLRFWEGKFPQIKPMKRGGGRRYYRPNDIALLHGVRILLHDDGYTIKGVQKILREQGVQYVKACVNRKAVKPPQTSTDDAPPDDIRASMKRSSSRPAGTGRAGENHAKVVKSRSVSRPGQKVAASGHRQAILETINLLEDCRAALRSEAFQSDQISSRQGSAQKQARKQL